jgi:hypothetical protein
MRVMCFENRRGYMEKRLFIIVVMSCAIVTSCDLLGLGEEKGAPQIKDFTWKIDTVQFPNLIFALNLSGESIEDLWFVNRHWESGMIKFKNNNTYVSTPIHFFSNIKHFKKNYYAGGLGSLKKLTFSSSAKLERIEPALNIDRTDLNFKNGSIIDIVLEKDDLYLLCTYDGEDQMPSYTTVIKWDGTTSTLLYTSEWGVQGQKIVAGQNGVFFSGFKINYEGDFVSSELHAIGNIRSDSLKMFIVGEKETDLLSLGILGDNVYLKYNHELFSLNNGKAFRSGITFPHNTFGFTGYSENNIIATGLTGFMVFDGNSWQQPTTSQLLDGTLRLGEPIAMSDGVVFVGVQRPLSSTFYLVRGSPK